MAVRQLDFDGDPLSLIEDAYLSADTVQASMHSQYEKDWLLYNAYVDMTGRDPDMPHVALPKMYAIVENKSPREVKALFGARPYLRWISRRDEFRGVAETQVDVVDELLAKALFFEDAAIANKLKILYGTSYMDAIPYYEPIVEKELGPSPITGQPEIQQYEAYRLRLLTESWAPWEIMVDPYAKSLSHRAKCRYIIKICLTSRRELKELYYKGAYPGLDVDKLNASGARVFTRYKYQHVGQQLLQAYGLPTPEDDDDVGILLRYESPDRYIDAWLGEVVLRDIPNPFNHGLINLSRWPHKLQPHTQNSFFGIGEAKPNSIQIAMLNDIWNMTLATHGLINQPMIFYRKGRINEKKLVWGFANRVPVDTAEGRPISDDVQVQQGNGLPADHYILPEKLERNIDLTAQNFSIQRGELATGGTDTATEVALLKESGDSGQELDVRVGELIFLADLSHKVSSIVDQFGNIGDAAEVVGFERAMQAFTMSPNDLPGGHNFTFRGSDYVANQLIKQRNMIQLVPLITALPNAKVFGIGEKLLEIFDFEEHEIRDMLYTEEEMMQMRLLLGALGPEGGEPAEQAPAGRTGAGGGAGAGSTTGSVAPNRQVTDNRQLARQIMSEVLSTAGGMNR